MSRFEKWSVWSTTFLIAATGIGYFWTKYLTVSADPFSIINHPLQPVFLKLHILVAPLFLLALGLVAGRHIWTHFRSGIRWSRRSGVSAALVIGPMILTGYLIQVIIGEGWLRAMALSHIAFGILYLGAIGLHRWFLRQPAPANGMSGRRDAAGTPPPGWAFNRQLRPHEPSDVSPARGAPEIHGNGKRKRDGTRPLPQPTSSTASHEPQNP